MYLGVMYILGVMTGILGLMILGAFMAKSGNKTKNQNDDGGGKLKIGEEDKPKVDGRSAWADHTNRFPIDQLLRKYGYTIWERKKNEEPVWKSCLGDLCRQGDALIRINPQEMKDAELADQLQAGGME